MTTSFDVRLDAGSVVTGKWKKRSYRVDRKLGAGANGSVYLVYGGRERYALKLSASVLELQGEINLLRKLARAGGGFADFLVDADDTEADGRTYAYYVMKYVPGEPPGQFLARHGRDWIGVIGLHLLRRLQELHWNGWVFGDLKTDNVLVSGHGRVELIDYGGVSEKGTGVRQFTEVFDRGYWGAGSRVAEEKYDLFAFGILVMQLLGRRLACFSPQLLPQNRTVQLLLEELEEDPAYGGYGPFLHKVLTGGFAGTEEAIASWRQASLGASAHEPRRTGLPHAGWLPYGFAGSLLLFAVTLYWYMS
ncbi:hypothetical protein J31TS4_46180 [Paenibacillus sp. J31TS4]|uniref:protein kinase domain-containing protein n=1 Tax=Paenibacillus sp. J31TS4 TaxID=2807195 RepID=UPI001B2EA62A|nr:phosphotransferase [Paenibacillus sp. J31TS4]GIP41338.1 hypothetical protein J31TS4_46180 [Paenibacillus sp. J31TS4]